MARLLGYRWHAQPTDALDALADEDGIVSVSPLVHETPAADQLRNLLSAAYGKAWSARLQAELLADAAKMGADITPASGIKVQDTIKGMYAASPDLVAAASKAIRE